MRSGHPAVTHPCTPAEFALRSYALFPDLVYQYYDEARPARIPLIAIVRSHSSSQTYRLTVAMDISQGNPYHGNGPSDDDEFQPENSDVVQIRTPVPNPADPSASWSAGADGRTPISVQATCVTWDVRCDTEDAPAPPTSTASWGDLETCSRVLGRACRPKCVGLYAGLPTLRCVLAPNGTVHWEQWGSCELGCARLDVQGFDQQQWWACTLQTPPTLRPDPAPSFPGT